MDAKYEIRIDAAIEYTRTGRNEFAIDTLITQGEPLLLEGIDPARGFATLRQSPIGDEVVPMQRGPLHNEAGNARRKRAGKNRQMSEIQRRTEFSVLDVDMRRWMIVVSHSDHDAQESAYFRHARKRHATTRKPHRPVSRLI